MDPKIKQPGAAQPEDASPYSPVAVAASGVPEYGANAASMPLRGLRP